MKMPEIKEPTHDELMVSRAHAAHRDVVESWVRGEKTEDDVGESKKRLHKVLSEYDHK